LRSVAKVNQRSAAWVINDAIEEFTPVPLRSAMCPTTKS
jgi:hypothetical protein